MYKELKDYFPDAVTGDGIFKAISNISWFPGVKPAQVDTYFILLHGEKLGSRILDAFADADDGTVKGDKLKALATMIHNKCINSWEHEYKTLTVEYNPIENTDYVESYKGSASGTSGGTTTEGGKITTSTKVNGLGSSSLVDDAETTQNFAPTDATARKTTVSGNSSGSDEHEIRKHGNIGVTTNAEMIASDIDVWKLNNFYDILCKDICDIIALSIF